MDMIQPRKRKPRKHQYADARAKISPVNRDEQLHAGDKQRPFQRAFAVLSSRPAGNWPGEGKNQRGESQQPRNHQAKRERLRMREQQSARRPADQRDQRIAHEHSARDGPEFRASRRNGCRRSRPESDGAGHIGGFFAEPRQAGERGECQKRSATGDRIDRRRHRRSNHHAAVGKQRGKHLRNIHATSLQKGYRTPTALARIPGTRRPHAAFDGSRLLRAGEPLGVDFAVSPEVLHALAGDLHEITDASGGKCLACEFRVHNFAALRQPHRRLDAGRRKCFRDGHRRMLHVHDARAPVGCVIGILHPAIVGVIALHAGGDQPPNDLAEMNLPHR